MCVFIHYEGDKYSWTSLFETLFAEISSLYFEQIKYRGPFLFYLIVVIILFPYFWLTKDLLKYVKLFFFFFQFDFFGTGQKLHQHSNTEPQSLFAQDSL